MLVLVILGAFMSLREEVVTTESLTAVLAFERQEINKVAMFLRALLADRQQLSIALLVGGGRGTTGRHYSDSGVRVKIRVGREMREEREKGAVQAGYVLRGEGHAS